MSRDGLPKFVQWLLLAVIEGVAAGLRLRMLTIALERDEGEYAYGGQLLMGGAAPYELFYTMKLPGTHAMYGLIMALFGETVQGIRAGMLLVNAASIAMLFVVTRRWLGPWAGLTAGLAYGVTSCHIGVLGQAAHATHFVVFFAPIGTVLLSNGGETLGRWRLATAGLMFGLAVLMKQSGAMLGIGAAGAIIGCWVMSDARRVGELARSLAWFAAAAVLPVVAVYAWAWSAGTLPVARFWTIEYARLYAAGMPMTTVWANVSHAWQTPIASMWPFWTMAACGLVIVVFTRRWTGSMRLLLAGAGVCSVLAVCPGWYFRAHYFVQLLPIGAVLCGAAAAWIHGVMIRLRQPAVMAHIVTLALLVAMAFSTIWIARRIMFQYSPLQSIRAIYTLNPFSESEPIVRHIAEHTSPEDTIAIFGSEPQICFLSHRRSCTGFIYTYGMMEPHAHAADMQRQMMDEVRQAMPAYVVIVNIWASWGRRADSDLWIIDEREAFVKQHYNLVGIVDVADRLNAESIFTWEDKLAEYSRESSHRVFIYRRK